MKLSDTQRVILSQASQRDDRLAIPPGLPGAARQAVAKSLIKQGLVTDEHATRYVASEAWQIDGRTRLLRITDAGLLAIGVVADEGDAAEPEEQDDRPRHEQLGIDEARIYGPDEEWQQPADEEAVFEQALAERQSRKLVRAAQALLDAWDASPAQDATDNPISRAVAGLRAAVAAKPKPARTKREPGTPRTPRQGTKQQVVLALLRRPEGATIAQICEATTWQQHTARGFLAALKKKGIDVTVLERVRKVGPNQEGARGSYSVYRAAD